ncbi:hypothetical protein NDU88_004013 [Pleurodeles waltl]|uniref:Uncharacterized protein n=1 Tax=Pleurodeles waltl TaxID=8319 RepID=A0AAV7RI78_PLEWA|nr:hypothetical protein NDU88_004013 [Pleurodeles waltl]
MEPPGGPFVQTPPPVRPERAPSPNARAVSRLHRQQKRPRPTSKSGVAAPAGVLWGQTGLRGATQAPRPAGCCTTCRRQGQVIAALHRAAGPQPDLTAKPARSKITSPPAVPTTQPAAAPPRRPLQDPAGSNAGARAHPPVSRSWPPKSLHRPRNSKVREH